MDFFKVCRDNLESMQRTHSYFCKAKLEEMVMINNLEML